MTLLGAAMALSALLLALAVGLTGWRMLRGPGIADRAVATADPPRLPAGRSWKATSSAASMNVAK